MSNFKCQHCDTDIVEAADGRYVTSCEHYPSSVKVQPVPSSPYVGPNGEFYPMGGGPVEPPPEPELPTFREFHNAYRRACRMVRRVVSGKQIYVRDKAPGEIKGKSAKRQAKRERVKALKAAQSGEHDRN